MKETTPTVTGIEGPVTTTIGRITVCPKCGAAYEPPFQEHDCASAQSTIRQLDVVQLLRSVGKVDAGEVGTVVYRWGTGQAYEVEFSRGRIETVTAKDLEKVS